MDDDLVRALRGGISSCEVGDADKYSHEAGSLSRWLLQAELDAEVSALASLLGTISEVGIELISLNYRAPSRSMRARAVVELQCQQMRMSSLSDRLQGNFNIFSFCLVSVNAAEIRTLSLLKLVRHVATLGMITSASRNHAISVVSVTREFLCVEHIGSRACLARLIASFRSDNVVDVVCTGAVSPAIFGAEKRTTELARTRPGRRNSVGCNRATRQACASAR